jgi:hypothetical protein
MPDYSKAIVYKLCCKDTNITEIYIGSTCNFSRRKSEHKSFCNNEKNKAYNLKVYQFIRDNGGFGFWDMIQVEAYPECANKRELEQYERYHIEELKPALNCLIPTRTDKEWRCDNKEIISEKYKEWYCDNKEIISEKYKKWYCDNKDKINEKIVCDCGSEITKRYLSTHKKTKKHLSIINC